MYFDFFIITIQNFAKTQSLFFSMASELLGRSN